MTKAFKADQLFVQLGTQSDRTTVASAFLDIATPQDGLQVGGDRNVTNLDTDHGSAGNLYSFTASRNTQAGNANWNLHPDAAGTIFGLCAAADTDVFGNIRWWNNNSTLVSGDINGRDLRGCVFNGFTLTADRSGDSVPIQLQTPVIPNAIRSLVEGTDTVPTPSFTTDLPYRTAGLLVDFKHNTSDNYGGNHPEVLGFTITYNRGAEVGVPQESLTAALDNVWTQVEGYTVELTVQLTISVDGYDYPWDEIDDLSPSQPAALRIAMTHANADSSTTGDTLEVASTGTDTLAFADASAFSADEICILQNAAGTTFTAAQIDSISTNDVTFDLAALPNDVEISGAGATVQNKGIFIDIPRMAYQGGNLQPQRQNRRRVVTLDYSAQIEVGETKLLDVFAYDHS